MMIAIITIIIGHITAMTAFNLHGRLLNLWTGMLVIRASRFNITLAVPSCPVAIAAPLRFGCPGVITPVIGHYGGIWIWTGTVHLSSSWCWSLWIVMFFWALNATSHLSVVLIFVTVIFAISGIPSLRCFLAFLLPNLHLHHLTIPICKLFVHKAF